MTECECPNICNKNNISSKNITEKLNFFKKKVWNEFIYGGHLVACVSPGLAFVTMVLFNLAVSLEFLVIVYLGTFCIYNYDRFKGADVDSSCNFQRSSYIKNKLKIRYFTLGVYGASFLIMLYIYGTLESLIFGIFLLLLGLLYVDVFKKFTSKIVGFKNIYTSFSFSLLTVFTMIYYNQIIDWSFLPFFMFVFLHFIVDTSFCDVKDMESDRKQNLVTLPIYFGKQNFLTILDIINLISFIVLLLAIVAQIIPWFSLALFIFCLYRIYYINKAKRCSQDNIQYLSSVIVDAEYFFWPFVLIIGNIFAASAWITF
jgi:4-hydroxybenzoate polyprenyltransferase